MDYSFSDKIASLKPSAIREILKYSADPQVIPFSAGNPAPEAFPVEMVRKITADIMQEDPIGALQYSVTEGLPSLRTMLKTMCKTRYQIGREFDELIVVSGAQQGVELATKVLCNEGDTVICETPSFIGSLNAFRSYNVNLCGVPMEEDGIDLVKLEEALKTQKNVRFIYLIPNFQNPSGLTTSLAKRKAVYELARQYSVMIIEDNPYGELRFEGEDIASIKTFDNDGLVIYCGSFSKVLSPGLRVGYALAPAPIIQKMVVAKQVADVHSNIMGQMICQRFLQQVDFDAHVARLREIYRKKSSLMTKGIEAHFPKSVSYVPVQGGLFMWCTLPNGCDMPAFCTRAVKDHKVAVVPGTAFVAKETDETTSFRINFSTPTDEQIVRGIEILGGMLKAL